MDRKNVRLSTAKNHFPKDLGPHRLRLLWVLQLKTTANVRRNTVQIWNTSWHLGWISNGLMKVGKFHVHVQHGWNLFKLYLDETDIPLAPKLPVRIWKHDKSNLGTRRTQETKTQHFATPGPTASRNEYCNAICFGRCLLSTQFACWMEFSVKLTLLGRGSKRSSFSNRTTREGFGVWSFFGLNKWKLWKTTNMLLNCTQLAYSSVRPPKKLRTSCVQVAYGSVRSQGVNFLICA